MIYKYKAQAIIYDKHNSVNFFLYQNVYMLKCMIKTKYKAYINNIKLFKEYLLKL